MVSSQQAAGSWQSRLAACPGLPATAGCRLPAAGFLPQVTTREGALPPRADVVDELRALLGREALVPVVVDHHDRRAIACAEALDLHQRERPRRVGLARLDSQLRAQLLGDALGAQQRARQRAAHVEHVLPDRPRVEHRVVRDDVLDLRGRAADLLGHKTHTRGGDVALLVLDEIERVQDGRLAPLRRIPLDDLVELLLVLGCVRERLARLRQLPFRTVELCRRVLHRGMKAHRSQSPMTTSVDPMTATRSAIMPCSTIFGSAWMAMNDGGRILTRHGRLVPSETM